MKMYFQRNAVFCWLTEEPVYTKVKRNEEMVDCAELKLTCEKPLRRKESKERFFDPTAFVMHAFDWNARSISGKIKVGFLLLVEFEIRNIDMGKGKPEQILEAVKIHFIPANNYNRKFLEQKEAEDNFDPDAALNELEISSSEGQS